MILVLMKNDLNEALQDQNGLKEVPPVDNKDPTMKTYVRECGKDANGNPVYRTEFVSAIFMPTDHHPNERNDFPSTGNTSKSYMQQNLNAQSGDERGHLIPSVLGGPAVSHNMAPQPASVNRNVGRHPNNGNWYKNEREMVSYLKAGNGFIRHEVQPTYADNNSGRPTSFKWVTAYYDTSGSLIRTVSGVAHSSM